MNPLDERLNRLFRAAALADTAPMAKPPFGLETRVLAAWRTAQVAPMWETGILVRGLLLAGMIMVISVWPALQQKNNFDSESLQFADSTVQADYP